MFYDGHMKLTLGQVSQEWRKAAGQCTDIAESTGERCKLPPHAGTTRCYKHGVNGATKRKAQARIAVDSWAGELYDPDSPPVTDPFAELARLGGIARNAMNVAGVKVNELNQWHDTDDDGRRTLKNEIQLWMQLVNFSEKVLKNLATLGLEDRMVRIKEAEATALLQCLQVALSAVQLEAPARAAIEEAYWTNVERYVEGVVVEESG